MKKMSDVFECDVYVSTFNNNLCIESANYRYLQQIDDDESAEETIALAAHAINMHDELVEQLQLSTDRLKAVWSNTGSHGAKAQYEANEKLLERCK